MLFYDKRKMYLLVSSFHGYMKHGRDVIRFKLCVHTYLLKTFGIEVSRVMRNCESFSKMCGASFAHM